MLSRAEIEKKHNKRHFSIGTIISALGIIVASSSVYAVDLLPYQPADARPSSSAARLLGPGSYDLGFQVRGSEGTVGRTALQDNAEGNDLVRRGGSASVILGAGLTDWLQLNIGLRSTNEKAEMQDRWSLIEENEVASELDSPRSTDFGGASVMAKVGLIRDGAFRCAIAPFIESGVGSAGTLALTRSDQPLAGWQLMLSYGKPGLAEFDLNTGYRYRNPEIVGDYMLRNELFYQGSAKGYFNHYFGLFVAGQGRVLTVSSQKDFIETQNREYKGFESGEASAGATLRFGSSEMNLYGGRRLQDYALGNGRNFAGISMRYVFKKRKESLADGIDHSKTPKILKTNKRPNEWQPSQKELADSKAKSKANEAAIKNAKGEQAVPEVLPPSLNMFEDIDQVLAEEFDKKNDPGDFGALPKDQEAVGGDPEIAAEDRIEQELRALRAADEKQAIEDRKKEKIAEDLRRQERLKRYQESIELEKKYREDLRKKLESLPEVSEEDYGWSGLEDGLAD